MKSLKSIKLRITGLIASCAIFIILYLIFFSYNPLILTILVIGSVAVVSTSTLYTVMHHIGTQDERERESKLHKAPKGPKGPKTIKTIKQSPEEPKEETPEIIDKYIDAFPRLKEYIETDESYEDMQNIRELIFSEFTSEELMKISMLELTDFEKLQFIREMLYYSREERELLMDSMLRYRGKDEVEITYTSPINTIEIGEALRTYVISLVEKGEKRKLLIADTTELISSIKERTGELFDYDLNNFLVSSGGIILDENKKVEDYNIEDEDEIVLIPSRPEDK